MSRPPRLAPFEPNTPRVDLSRVREAQPNSGLDRKPARETSPRRGSGLYKTAWTLMFFGSLSYLWAIGFAPEHLPASLRADLEQDAPTQVAVAPSPVPPAIVPTPYVAALPPSPPAAVAEPRGHEPVRPTVLNGEPPTSRIETGAVPKEPATAGPFGVQVGNAPSLDTLHLVWTRLVERHRPQLAQAEPRFVSTEPNMYTLIAGPFATEADARQVCSKLATRNDVCKVRGFTGDALN